MSFIFIFSSVFCFRGKTGRLGGERGGRSLLVLFSSLSRTISWSAVEYSVNSSAYRLLLLLNNAE